MTNEQVRLYVGSVAAVDGTGNSYQFEPFVTMTTALELAARQAMDYVYRHWPSRDGWTDHCAVIAPLPVEMYKAIGDAAADGCLDVFVGEEKLTLFKFTEPKRADWPETIH